jgi:competence protein ComEC
MTRPRLSLIIVVWLALLGATRVAAQDSTAFVVRTSARPCAKVRLRPATDAPWRECVKPGVQVAGIGVAPFWRKVRLASGRTGWIAKQLLEAGATPASASSGVHLTPPVPPARDDAWLEVHIVDVGQGDAIWIHTFDDGIPGNGRYEGRSIVIDGGPDASDGKNEFLKYLLQQAPENAIIDALIVTHPHDDHYPGARGVLRHFQVRDYYDPGYPSESSKYAAFRREVADEMVDGNPITLHIGWAQFGQPNWGSELDVRFLYAYRGSAAGFGSGNTLVNNASIVLRIAYGNQSFLFMGDAEGKERRDDATAARYVERWLLDSVGPAGLKSTVLKVSHHGSETSSTNPFIQAVDPRVVIVSSGRKKFGPRYLPDATTLRRYCEHNAAIRIYRTDENDAAEGRTAAADADGDNIVLRTNGTGLLIEAYSAGTRVTPTACATN